MLGVRLTFLENKRVLLAKHHSSVSRKEGMEGLAVEKSVNRINVLQPKIARNTPIGELVGFSAHCSEGGRTPWGTVGQLSKKLCGRINSRSWAWVR